MKKNVLHWALCAAMLLMPLGANAQFGGLKKLKDKAQTAVKQQAGEQVQQKAAGAAATAQMSEEQRWSMEQLQTLSEAPELPNLMKPTDDAYSGGSIVASKLIKDFTQVMGKANHNQVVEMRGKLDARVAYNLRVTEAFRRDNVSYDLPSDAALRKNFQLLLDEVSLFEAVQEQAGFNIVRLFQDVVKRNGQMTLPANSSVWPPSNAKSHPVRRDPNDGKCKFYDGNIPYKIDSEEVERVKTITLNFIDNAITLMEINPDFDKREKIRNRSYDPQASYLDVIDKAKVAKAAILEALENNK